MPQQPDTKQDLRARPGGLDRAGPSRPLGNIYPGPTPALAEVAHATKQPVQVQAVKLGPGKARIQ
jgi:hypothetical protein